MPSPITCLGKTFATEDERRSYFRDELRKQLPELRKIDGFPIGTDEDILNLSDPPYFTACPNPWLNNFIDEWNKEKDDLEKNNSRSADFAVPEPYASDVSEGKNNPIYNAHSYHTKVPHPAIMRYILHYTQPGDIVFDGFAGTGMTGVAAQLCGSQDAELKFKIDTEFRRMGLLQPKWGRRNAICGDLSPIASFIACNYNNPVDIAAFDKKSNEILKEVETDLGWMYSTTHSNGKPGRILYTIWSDIFVCASCGRELVFWDNVVDEKEREMKSEFECPHCQAIQSKSSMDKAIVTVFDENLKASIRKSKSVPVLINYTSGGKRYEKRPDENDLKLIQKIESSDKCMWFPTSQLPPGDKMGDPLSKGMTHSHHFYTKRNLIVLSTLWNKLNSNFLKMPLTAVLVKTASVLHNIGLKNGSINLAGALPNALYGPSNFAERNIFELVSGKVRDFIIDLPKTRSLVYVSSATEIKILDESVDYIFTDPPFGANLMYSELNYIHESWLKVFTNNNNEAIENRTQGKSTLIWQNIMTDAFREYYRILKPGKWMTVEFSNTNAAVWNGIQTSLTLSGFVVANVAALNKQQGSYNSQTNPTSVKQDLVISCYKPTHDFDEKFKCESGEVNIWSFVEEHLNHLPVAIIKEKTSTAIIERSPKILYDRLITFYLMRGLPIPIDAAEFQAKLKQKFRESDGMIFTVEQNAQYEDQKQKQGITQQLSLVFDIIYSESDAVEWLKVRLAKSAQKYNEIQPDFRKANTATRKGEKEFELQTLLNENFIPLPDGCWRVPDMYEAKDREHFRTTALLKEFGRYIEELANPKTKKLKDVRVEALHAGFKSCWEKKEFTTIVNVAEKIPQNLLMEDEQLLMFYDIAKDKV